MRYSLATSVDTDLPEAWAFGIKESAAPIKKYVAKFFLILAISPFLFWPIFIGHEQKRSRTIRQTARR
jgi:hypothetical protein